MNVVEPTHYSRLMLAEHGYSSVAHVPLLMNEDGSYPVLVNRYLRARALMEWQPRIGTNAKPRDPKRDVTLLTVKTLKGIAQRLGLFLRWVAEDKRRDPLKIDYSGLLEWQNVELTKTVKEATANLYASEAALYLTWLSLVPRGEDGRPIRAPFNVPLVRREVDSHRGDSAHKQKKVVESRIGQLKPKPQDVVLPTDAAIGRWLDLQKINSGTRALMSRVSLDSGVRISELNYMQVGDLPPQGEWRPVGGRVFFWIHMGVKGQKVLPDSMKARRPRKISLSVKIARLVDEYRREGRELQIRRWIRAAGDKSEKARREGDRPTRLWLSEDTNVPVTNSAIQKAWSKSWAKLRREMPSEPVKWSPHSARHYFAVNLLVDCVMERIKQERLTLPSLTWAEGIMRDEINTVIRNQLGHLSEETTRIYLQAAKLKLAERLGSPSLNWHSHQEREVP